MLAVILVCVLIAIPSVFFILYPLLGGYEKKQHLNRLETFASETELEQILVLRDALLQKLIYGKSVLKEVDILSENEIYHSLISICSQLTEAELPKFPNKIQAPELNELCDEGFVKNDFLVSLGMVAISFLLLFVFIPDVKANSTEHKKQNMNVPAEVTIPPPTILEKSGYWLPAVNQFILMPMLGKVRVYYVGMFSNTLQAKETLLQLPLPKDFYDLQILGLKNATLEKNSFGESPIINLTLEPGINQISAEFFIPAPFGIAKWQASDLKELPGVTIFMMPEQNAALRNLLSVFIDKPNIWPPRIENIPTSFRSILGPDPLENIQVKLKDPNLLSRQLVRVGEKSVEFPVFDIYGVVPNRSFIYLLIGFFAFFLFGVTAFSIFKTSK